MEVAAAAATAAPRKCKECGAGIANPTAVNRHVKKEHPDIARAYRSYVGISKLEKR